MDLQLIKKQVEAALNDLFQSFAINNRHIMIVGTSTSEVLGKHIGSAGSEDVAREIYGALSEAQSKHRFHLAFQGCEHINRALVVERETADIFALETVTVIPIRKAGGAMATYAFQQMKDPVVVEFIKADCGIDIGDTLIGMHLKHVAVPVRSTIKKIGEANLTMAKTRPKLIGGARAQYSIEPTSIIKDIKKIESDGETC